MSNPHVEDIGTRIEYLFIAASTGLLLDISTATIFKLRIQRPDDTVVEVDQASTPNAVAFVTDGTDGKIDYVVPDSTLWSVEGLYRIQGYVEIGSFKASGQIKTQVVDRLVA